MERLARRLDDLILASDLDQRDQVSRPNGERHGDDARVRPSAVFADGIFTAYVQLVLAGFPLPGARQRTLGERPPSPESRSSDSRAVLRHPAPAAAPTRPAAVTVGGSLQDIIVRLRITDRDWQILDARHAIGKGRTLQEIADDLRLTRERVRQITVKVVTRLQRELPSLDVWLKPLEARAWAIPESLTDADEVRRAVDVCRAILQRSDAPPVGPDDISRLLTIVRALAYHDAATTSARWRFLTFIACRADPPIGRLPDIAAEMAHSAQAERARNRSKTYRELAQDVLAEAGEPLHWTVIVARAERLGRRETVEPAGLRNVLHGFAETFARVAAGTYGLRAWGLTSVPFYLDVIASILTTSDRPMSQSEISARMEMIRPIKDSSLTFYLMVNPLFYGSADRRFGLREWLAEPRHRVGEPSSAWQEHPVSLRRMEQRTVLLGDPDTDDGDAG